MSLKREWKPRLRAFDLLERMNAKRRARSSQSSSPVCSLAFRSA
jgi:hypothetical protein